MRHWLTLVAGLSLLTGCAGFVRSDISVFHEVPPTFTATYTVILTKEQIGSLEYKTYEQDVKRELDAKGFREVPFENADIAVYFSYGIDTGREVVESYPIIGQTGVSSSYSYGSVNTSGGTGTYSGITTYSPSYGVVGTGVTSSTEYMRFFNLDLLDKKSLNENQIKKLYEAKVTSRGRTGQLAVVLPAMIKALFEDFPGKSGKPRRSFRPLRNE